MILQHLNTFINCFVNRYIFYERLLHPLFGITRRKKNSISEYGVGIMNDLLAYRNKLIAQGRYTCLETKEFSLFLSEKILRHKNQKRLDIH